MTNAVRFASPVTAGTRSVLEHHAWSLGTLVVLLLDCRNNNSGDPLGAAPVALLACRLNNDSGDHAMSSVVVPGTLEVH